MLKLFMLLITQAHCYSIPDSKCPIFVLCFSEEDFLISEPRCRESSSTFLPCKMVQSECTYKVFCMGRKVIQVSLMLHFDGKRSHPLGCFLTGNV